MCCFGTLIEWLGVLKVKCQARSDRLSLRVVLITYLILNNLEQGELTLLLRLAL